MTKTVRVTGAPGRILGIDVRPADGMLYALAADGSVLNTATGKATVVAKIAGTSGPVRQIAALPGM